MKKVTKFVLIALLACVLVAGAMAGTILSGSNLNPIHTFIQYNGSNAIELSKDGVRTGANTWQVTLGVTNLLDEVVSTKPVEVAIVIDGSLSMTSNTVSGTSKTRLKVVQEAAVAMIEDLFNKAASLGITIKVSLSTFNTDAQVRQTMLSLNSAANKTTLINAINNINSDRDNAYTNLQGGILRGISTFYSNFSYTYNSSNKAITINSSSTFNDPNSVKLMVVLTDGEANRYFTNNSFGGVTGSSSGGDANAQDAAIKAATAIKDKGVSVFSIGFTHTDSTLEGIASYAPGSTTQKLYYTATTAIDLSSVFQTITNQVESPALSDTMGTYLLTSSGTVTGPSGVTIGNSGSLLLWTPAAGALVKNHGNFITYTVTLDITNLAAGTYDNYALNNGATFGVVINNTTCTGNFPQPTGKFDIGTLDVHFKAGSATIAPSEPQQKLITDWGTPKFTVNTPPATIVYNGVTYYYDGSTYDNNTYTIPSSHQQSATVGTHTLIHNYSVHNRNVTYSYTGTVPTGAPSVPATATYAAGTANISVASAPSLVGYTFSGWSTTDATVTTGKFTMPDKNVAFTGSWTPNTNTAYKVEHYKQTTSGTYNTTPDDTDNLTGTTGTAVSVTSKSYTGFAYNSALTTSNNTVSGQYIIKGDGTLVVKLYYVRNTHNVRYEYSGTVPNGAPAVPGNANYSFGTANIAVANTPVLAGYTFNGWNTSDVTLSAGKFTMPDNDVVFTGSWTANGNTAYKVEHYKQTAAGTFGTTPDETDNLTGTTGANAGYTQKSYAGFTYDDTKTVSNNTVGANFIIKGDGTLVIKLYYVRNTHTVSYQYTGTIPTGAPAVPANADYRFGVTDISVAAAPTFAGYTFSGWSTTDATVTSGKFTMPDKNVVFKGSWTPNTNTAYKVEHYKQTTAGTYAATPDETDNLTGTTNTAAAFTSKTYAGFSYDSALTTSNNTVSGSYIIKGDGTLVIKLYYVRNKHTVSYQYTGTVPTGAPTVPANADYRFATADISVAAAPTFTGYTFSGWGTTDVTVTDGKFTMPDKNVAFSGSWTPNADTAYKVEHYKQTVGGTFGTMPDETDNLTGTTGTAAAFTSKTYTGFAYDSTLTTSSNTVGVNYIIKEDGSLVIKLYYKRNVRTVSYEYVGTIPSNATVLPTAANYPFEAPVTVAPNATATNYTFSGWSSTQVPGVMAGQNFSMPNENVVFTGSFTANTAVYAVEHYTQDLTGGGYTKVDTIGASGNAGTVAAYTPNFYTGFTYAPTMTTSNNTVGSNFIIKNDGTLVIKLYYLRNSYNVSYSYTNDPVPSGATALPLTLGYSFGANVTVADNASAPGYTFGGWSTTDAAVSGGAFTMPAKDVVIVGTLTPSSDTAYKVEHYKQTLTGTYSSTPDESENKSGTTGTSAAFTAKTYAGFTYDSSATVSNNTIGTAFIIKADGTLVIKLYYTRNANYTYRVEYRKDSTTGTLLDSKSVANRMWGQTYDEVAIAIFGYTAQAPLTQSVTIDADNKVIIFIYKANKHNVTYQLTGTIPPGFNTSVLAGLGATGVEFNTPMTRANDLTAANYNFTGWVTSDVAVNASGSYTMPDQDVVFVGSFTLMPAWVVYEYTGDVPNPVTPLPETKYYNVGNGVTIASNPAAVTGYTFEGWTRNGSAAANFTIGATGEYKVIGNWVRNTYKVTYQYDSSAPATAPAVPGQQTVPFKQNVTVDTTVGNITGYTFNGWVPTSGLATADITGGTFAMPSNDVVFTGSWTVKKHNVTYQLTGEIPAGFNTSVLATLGASGVAFNTPMTVAGPLSATNYEFHGWTSGQVTPANGNYAMPDSDVVFTGYFTKKVFTVTYIYIGTVPAGAPALPAGSSYEVGVQATMASPVSMAGYAFYGWTSNVSVNFATRQFTMPNHDVVFTGWWAQENSVPSSIPSYYYSSASSSVPSSAPSSVPYSSTATSSKPIVSVSENQTPLDVINMGPEENIIITIILGVFSAIVLIVVILVNRKVRKAGNKN